MSSGTQDMDNARVVPLRNVPLPKKRTTVVRGDSEPTYKPESDQLGTSDAQRAATRLTAALAALAMAAALLA